MSESLWSARLTSGQQLDNQSTADLKTLVAAGKLGPEDTVYREGLDDWVKARKLKGLFPTTQSTTQAPQAGASTPSNSPQPPATQPESVPDKKPGKLMPQIIVGVLIFLVVLMVLKFVTGLHFVLGVLAGFVVIGAAGAATFVLLFKPDMLPEHLRPKLRLAKAPLVSIALAGLLGTMAAITVPRLEREAVEDAEQRAELLAQAEAAYEDGRLEGALDLAEDALYYGSAFDDDPNRDTAQRMRDTIQRAIDERAEEVRLAREGAERALQEQQEAERLAAIRAQEQARIQEGIEQVQGLMQQATAQLGNEEYESLSQTISAIDSIVNSLPADSLREDVASQLAEIQQESMQHLQRIEMERRASALDTARALSSRAQASVEDYQAVIELLNEVATPTHAPNDENIAAVIAIRDSLQQRLTQFNVDRAQQQTRLATFRAMSLRELVRHVDNEIIPTENDRITFLWGAGYDYYRDRNYGSFRVVISEIPGSTLATVTCRDAVYVLMEKLSANQ